MSTELPNTRTVITTLLGTVIGVLLTLSIVSHNKQSMQAPSISELETMEASTDIPARDPHAMYIRQIRKDQEAMGRKDGQDRHEEQEVEEEEYEEYFEDIDEEVDDPYIEPKHLLWCTEKNPRVSVFLPYILQAIEDASPKQGAPGVYNHGAAFHNIVLFSGQVCALCVCLCLSVCLCLCLLLPHL